MALKITSFFEDDKKLIKVVYKNPAVKELYYKDFRVGYLMMLPEGFSFVKEVNLIRHRGLGQYYKIHKKVGTAKAVIDILEKAYKDLLKLYAVKFVADDKPVGWILYDWIYYKNNRKMVQEEGYETQYHIDLPEDVDIYMQEAFERNKIFRIIIDVLGKREEEWYQP